MAQTLYGCDRQSARRPRREESRSGDAGLVADCLETLEEIAVENAAIFREHGGENFAALPCLNDSEDGLTVLRQLALRELAGWIEQA